MKPLGKGGRDALESRCFWPLPFSLSLGSGIQTLGKWLSSLRRSFSRLLVLCTLVMAISLTSGCSEILKSAATTALGASQSGLEVSPTVQTGGGNKSSDGLVNADLKNESTTNNQVQGNQTVNEGPDKLDQIILIIVSVLLGLFALDNLTSFYRKWRDKRG